MIDLRLPALAYGPVDPSKANAAHIPFMKTTTPNTRARHRAVVRCAGLRRLAGVVGRTAVQLLVGIAVNEILMVIHPR